MGPSPRPDPGSPLPGISKVTFSRLALRYLFSLSFSQSGRRAGVSHGVTHRHTRAWEGCIYVCVRAFGQMCVGTSASVLACVCKCVCSRVKGRNLSWGWEGDRLGFSPLKLLMSLQTDCHLEGHLITAQDGHLSRWVRPGYGSVSTRQGLTLHTWEPSGFLDGCLGNTEFVPKGRPWQ